MAKDADADDPDIAELIVAIERTRRGYRKQFRTSKREVRADYRESSGAYTNTASDPKSIQARGP
jgi:hypothetical protein